LVSMTYAAEPNKINSIMGISKRVAFSIAI
jgi:hypothetical protein